MAHILEFENVSKSYKSESAIVRACQSVDLTISEGQVVGLVGESGSGKSTLANLALGLETSDSGSIKFNGIDLKDQFRDNPKGFRRDVQAVFQHPCFSPTPEKQLAG